MRSIRVIPRKTAIVLVVCVIALYLAVDITERVMSAKLVKAIRGYETEQAEIARLIDKTWNLDSLNGYAFMTIIDYYISTPMTSACGNSDYETVELLIEKGAQVNYVNGDIYSPLTCVTYGYQASIVRGTNYSLLELLLKNGADPNFAIRDRCPIMDICNSYASSRELNWVHDDEQEYWKALKLLMEYGAQVDANYDGETVLHKLVRDNNANCLKYFLDNYELDINVQNSQGRTLLMEACMRNFSTECLQLLLENGADKSIKDNDGKTAYDYALEYGNPLSEELK